jgi:hypothetical protein
LGPNMLTKHVPCVDGSELARDIFTFAELVGAGMCSACLRGGEAAGHNAFSKAKSPPNCQCSRELKSSCTSIEDR